MLFVVHFRLCSGRFLNLSYTIGRFCYLKGVEFVDEVIPWLSNAMLAAWMCV